MSNLYLTSTAADSAITSGSGTKWAMAATAGASPRRIVKATVSGATPPLQMTDGTIDVGDDAVDGAAISWYSPPLEAVTISGQIVALIWTKSKNTSANASPTIRIERVNGDGSGATTIVSETVAKQHNPSIEPGTAEASHTLTMSASAVTDTSISAGQRIRITLWIDDNNDQGGFGNMGSSYYMAMWVNGPNGSQGQSEIAFAETLVFQGPTYQKTGVVTEYSGPVGGYAQSPWASSAVVVETDHAADLVSSSETARIALSGADTGSSADVSSLSTSQTRTDTGSGVDASSLTASRTLADNGSSAEGTSTSAARTLTDSGSGTDASSLSVSRTLADAGSGAEGSTTASALSHSETGSSADFGSVSTGLSLPDVGVSDEGSSVSSALSETETGSVLDAGVVGAAQADASTSSEAGSVVVSISSSDAGSGLETGGVGDALSQKSSTDSAVSVDSSTLVASRTLADTGSGTESQSLSSSLSSPDVITPLDNFVSLSAELSGNEDGGLEINNAQVFPVLSGSDTGSVTDTQSLTVSITGSEIVTSASDSTIPPSSTVGEDLVFGQETSTILSGLGSADTGDSDEESDLARAVEDTDQVSYSESSVVSVLASSSETVSTVESTSLHVILASGDAGVSFDGTLTENPSQPREDSDVGYFEESLGEIALGHPQPAPYYPSFVEVLQQVRVRENGSLKVTWAPVTNSPALRFFCRFDLSVPPPGKEGLPPPAAGVVLDRIGLMMCDKWVGASLRAGQRVRALSGPIQGTFDIRNTPEQAMGYDSAHHLEVGVIEVAQSSIGTNVRATTPTVPSGIRHLYATRVEILRRVASRESGSTSERWEKSSDVIDAMLGVPGEMKCRLDLQFRRVGRDTLPPITAGRVQDRVGTLVCDVTPNLKAGDRLRCIAGDISGTFEIKYVPDLAPNLTSVHHLEVQVVEVAQSLSGVQT